MLYTVLCNVNGRRSTLPTITFNDETGAWGQFREDTQVVGISSGTELVSNLSGAYTHTFTDGDPATAYKYSLHLSYNNVDFYYVGRHGYNNVTKTITIPTTQHYSSEAEIRRMLGKYATELILDDDDMEDYRDVWDAVLYDVDDTINMYLEQMYDLDSLRNNSWVRRRSTILGMNFLSQRRGSPPLLVDRTQKVFEELEALRDGRFMVPGATVKGFQGATVRNYSLQNRYRRHPLRVVSTKSTGDTYDGITMALEPYVY